jgi:hypothetical protein
MRTLLTVSLLVVLLLLPASAFGQQGGQHDGNPVVVSLPQGGFAGFKIEVSPVNSPTFLRKRSGILPPFLSRVVMGEGNTLHRLLVDEQGRFVFVYDLVIVELDSPKRFEVSARAPDPGFQQSLRAHNASALQNVADAGLPTLATATERQTVAEGETVALDLLINEPLGVKVVDYITVASERSLLSPSRPARPARDFGVYNVELAIKNYQLYVDEKPVYTSGLRNCTGAMVWFYLPGHGRFIFSLVPYDGYPFRKVGTIEDNKITFTWKGVRYQWVSREPIVGSGGLWNLWVLRDEQYVDIFDRPTVHMEQKVAKRGERIRSVPALLGMIARPRNREDTKLDSHRTVRNPSPPRVRVVIGSAKTIETLLPRK